MKGGEDIHNIGDYGHGGGDGDLKLHKGMEFKTYGESNAKEHVELGLGENMAEGGDDMYNVGDDVHDVGDANIEHHEDMEFESYENSNEKEHVELRSVENMADGDDDMKGGEHMFGDIVHNGGNIDLEPHQGMEFRTYEEASSFYKAYARQEGFVISTKSSRRSKKNDELIDVKLVCSRFGEKREKFQVRYPRPSAKTGCKASMYVKKRESDGIWFTYTFSKEHNHELVKEESQVLRSHRRVNTLNKNNVKISGTGGVQRNKSYAGYQNVGFIEKNIEGELAKAQHLAFEAEDAQAIHEYLMHMQEENPNFFYALDLNEDQHLRNVFWVDAKGRHDYIDFGDVVSFDTAYVTNKYKIPLAPFIGVNHHGQSMLLGCALIADETTSTFVWLMKTWLNAMSGQAPKTITTVQDNAMKEAIARVFPKSRHCFCLWDMAEKIPEKLGYIIQQNKNFMEKFNKCVYLSSTEEEFERRWWEMIVEFEITEDEWLRSLYEDRRHWVPTYVRDMVLAGMSTLQQRECLNSFFDKYVSKKTTLKEFLERYEEVLDDSFEKESIADFQSWYTRPELKSPSPYEYQMSSVYTRDIFTKFQLEVMGTHACYATKERDERTVTFRVNDLEQNQEFTVDWNETESDISCLCRLFEFKGFLCRHAIAVLQCLGMDNIPSHYILKRWTRDARSSLALCQRPNAQQSRVQRYNDLYRRAIILAHQVSLSQESYNVALSVLDEGMKIICGQK